MTALRIFLVMMGAIFVGAGGVALWFLVGTGYFQRPEKPAKPKKPPTPAKLPEAKVRTSLIDWILCKLGKCRRCRLHDTSEGIGGKCIACGRLHGWMTSAELREVWGRRP